MLIKTDIKKRLEQLLVELKKREDAILRFDLKFPVYKDCSVAETLWMRPIFPRDYIDMFDCFSNKDSMKYWGKGIIYDLDGLKNYFIWCSEKNISNPQTSGWSIITCKGLAGCFWAHVKKFDSETHKNISEVEIAYVSRPGFAGKGLTTEAGNLILNVKFSYPDFNGKIIATVHPENKASQRVLSKLGLKPDPSKQNVPMYGSIRNFYEYEVKAPKESPILYAFQKRGILHKNPQASSMIKRY